MAEYHPMHGDEAPDPSRLSNRHAYVRKSGTEYTARNPQPNYSEFGKLGIDAIDSNLFEYIFPSKKHWRQDDASGRTLLWIRRRTKHRETPFPSEGDLLELYRVETRQSIYVGKRAAQRIIPEKKPDHKAIVREIYVENGHATGHLLVSMLY